MDSLTLSASLQHMTRCLLVLANNASCFPLAADCRYVLSEITNEQLSDKERYRQLRVEPKLLPLVLPELLRRYPDIYDLNLYVHEARRDVTVIDIRYYLKASLPSGYFPSVARQPAMLHAKVPIPFWLGNSSQQLRYDLNWRRGAAPGRWHRWGLTWWWQLRAWWHRLPPPTANNALVVP